MTPALRTFILVTLMGSSQLVIISLLDLYSHFSERTARRHVLAEGQTATASLHEPSGLEYVTVSWTDTAGSQRSGQAWTSKRFAREFQAMAAVARPTEVIKYVADIDIDPVILSEASERERTNDNWMIVSGLAAVSSSIMTFAAAMAYFMSRAKRAASATPE